MSIAPPIDWVTIENVLAQWVYDVMGLRAKMGQQDIAERKMPYITMDRLNGPIGDRDFHTQTVVENMLTVISEGPREFTITFKASTKRDEDANSDAVALLTRLGSSHYMVATQELMQENAIALVQVNGVLDISLVINGEWISRASMDVRFRTGSQIKETIPYFEKVHVESEHPAVVDKEIGDE